MKRTLLIPLAHTVNFQVGVPSNPCPNFRYDGSDPLIQFPAGAHIQVNGGTLQGASGGYDQNCDTLIDNAYRVAVIDDDGRNVIQLTGGLPGRPGGAMLAYPFRAVPWSSQNTAGGEAVSFETTLKFLSEPTSERYFNFEIRGFLNFRARKNESVECVSVQITRGQVMVSWYRDAVDGDGVEKKIQVKESPEILSDEWHRFTTTLTALAAPDTWQAAFKIRSQKRLVWQYASDETNHPNNIATPDTVVMGDERSRDEWGGVTYIARIAVFAEEVE